MFREISMKYLKRSKLKTFILICLTSFITIFFVLGVGMLVNSNLLLKQADRNFTTVGILEYIAGEYPQERSMKTTSEEEIGRFPLNKVVSQKEVLDFQNQHLMMGYVDNLALTPYFDVAFYHYSIIEFQVLYGTSDGGYRCTLSKIHYSNSAKDGNTFGLSFIDEAEKKKYNFQVGHRYIASGDFRNENNMLMFRPAGVSSIVPGSKLGSTISDYPAVDITSDPSYMERTENKKAWKEISDYYRIQNGSFQIVALDSLKTNRDFYLGNNYIVKGKIWSNQSPKKSEKVCVVHSGIASILGKEVGDTIEFSTHFSEQSSNYYNSYDEKTGFAEKNSYRIVGIYDSIQEENDPYIFIPASTCVKLPQKQNHFYLGSILIQNGSAQEYLDKIEPFMKDYFRITIFDQGYAQATDPIKAMRTNSMMILVLCGACSIAILLLFANLFVSKQQDTIAVMTALGTTKQDSMFFILRGAFIILGSGALLGSIIGFALCKSIISMAYTLSKEIYKRDLRFSSLQMGVQVPFEGQIESSVWVALLVGIVILISGLVLSYFTARKLIQKTATFGGNISKKKKIGKVKTVQAAATPKETFSYQNIQISKHSFCPGKKFFYTIKQSLRSIRRNGKTSFVLMLIAFVITFFIIFYNLGMDQFRQELEKTYDTAKIDGYYATIAGQHMDARAINLNIQRTIVQPEYVKKVYNSSSCKYEYVDKLSQTKSKEELKKEQERVSALYEAKVQKPTGFGIEARIDEIRNDEELVATQNLDRCKEFFQYTSPVVEYLKGYEGIIEDADFQIPAGQDGVIPVLVSDQFSKNNHLALDDVILIAKLSLLPTIYTNEIQKFVSEPQLCRVVGIYKSKTNGENIYTRYLEEGLTIRAQNPYKENKMDQFRMGNSFINYQLNHVRDFTKFRNQLEELGVTPVGVMGQARTCFVIDDKEMVQTVDNIQNNISFMGLLRYALFLLIFFIGFIAAFMTMRTRRADIAIIRSLGTGKVRTFLMFFLEYALIGLAGVAFALLILQNLMSVTVMNQFGYVLTFYLSFILGSGVCVARMNRKNVLEILSNAE